MNSTLLLWYLSLTCFSTVFYLFIFYLQVAELKRTLELEEMRKFRQMSRPSFVSENSNPNSSITQDDFEYTIHEDYSE